MITIPKTNNLVSIVGIDPGTNILGLTIIKFDALTGDIVEVHPQDIMSKDLYNDPWLAEIHGDTQSRIKAICDEIREIIEETNPIAIASERPFISVKNPSAFAPLVEMLANIRSIIIHYDIWKPFYLFEPTVVKNAVGAKGNANKDDVRLSTKNIKQLMDNLTTPIDELGPDAVDSIAVCYKLYTMLLRSGLPHI